MQMLVEHKVSVEGLRVPEPSRAVADLRAALLSLGVAVAFLAVIAALWVVPRGAWSHGLVGAVLWSLVAFGMTAYWMRKALRELRYLLAFQEHVLREIERDGNENVTAPTPPDTLN